MRSKICETRANAIDDKFCLGLLIGLEKRLHYFSNAKSDAEIEQFKCISDTS